MKIDFSMPVFQQRHCQRDRDASGPGSGFFPEGQLVEEDIVLGCQVTFLNVIVNIDRELAFLDR